ncbi:CUEDC1 [Branchiostoma lanceolatum]|uniref:CUEDC1 protein n=1 Tax=Branchiostoma lanceolatum TaxID=7740 RepID=A0A8J9WDQ5_BRALA|nr:CUEDC1 [Branchiostoma lanceolatum]
MATAPDTQMRGEQKEKGKKGRSLFSRRSRSSRGSDSEPPVANNMVTPPTPGSARQLEFNQAMHDFMTMFPSIDRDVIEAVLRSNNGAVDATIDQLLQMNEDNKEDGEVYSDEDEDEIPPEVLQPDSSDDEPPPVYTPRADPPPSFFASQGIPTPPPSSSPLSSPIHLVMTGKELNVSGSGGSKPFRNWNPPLLGQLPDDFLRIQPTPEQLRAQGITVSPPKSPQKVSSPKQKQAHAESGHIDKDLQQYLEDERIALFLQNEEFLRELRRNQEFISALERDRLRSTRHSSLGTETGDPLPPPPPPPPLEGKDLNGPMPPLPPVHENGGFHHGDGLGAAGGAFRDDDAMFKERLKHMGKSTRKKFNELARKFSRRGKPSGKQLLSNSSAPSTANLLEEEEYIDDNDEHHRERHERERERPFIEPLPGAGAAAVHRQQLMRQKYGLTSSGNHGNTEPIVFYQEDDHFQMKEW